MSGLMRAIKIAETIYKRNLVNFGNHDAPALFIGRDADGEVCLACNFSHAQGAFATGDKLFFVKFRDIGSALPDSMRTQSHSVGEFVASSFIPVIIMESPADFVGAHAKFMLDVVHILRGQLSAPCEIHLTANGVLPTVNGVFGAVADVFPAEATHLLPAIQIGSVSGI